VLVRVLSVLVIILKQKILQINLKFSFAKRKLKKDARECLQQSQKGYKIFKFNWLKMKIYLRNISLTKKETVLVGRTPMIIILWFLF